MPVPLNRKVLDFTIFFNINCYGANDFPYTEEGSRFAKNGPTGHNVEVFAL